MGLLIFILFFITTFLYPVRVFTGPLLDICHILLASRESKCHISRRHDGRFGFLLHCLPAKISIFCSDSLWMDNVLCVTPLPGPSLKKHLQEAFPVIIVGYIFPVIFTFLTEPFPDLGPYQWFWKEQQNSGLHTKNNLKHKK